MFGYPEPCWIFESANLERLAHQRLRCMFSNLFLGLLLWGWCQPPPTTTETPIGPILPGTYALITVPKSPSCVFSSMRVDRLLGSFQYPDQLGNARSSTLKLPEDGVMYY